MALLDRLRRAASKRRRPTRARRPIPPAGVIRRERRTLLRAREEKLLELGGLMLEMYRRDRFRESLLAERCNELLGIDARLRELDAMLAVAHGRVPAGRCPCGAPLLLGAHFCPNCGRPAGERPILACEECGHPLPADGRFCAACGAPSEQRAEDEQVGEERRPAEEEQTGEHAGSAEEEPAAEVEQPQEQEHEQEHEREAEPKEAW